MRFHYPEDKQEIRLPWNLKHTWRTNERLRQGNSSLLAFRFDAKPGLQGRGGGGGGREGRGESAAFKCGRDEEGGAIVGPVPKPAHTVPCILTKHGPTRGPTYDPTCGPRKLTTRDSLSSQLTKLSCQQSTAAVGTYYNRSRYLCDFRSTESMMINKDKLRLHGWWELEFPTFLHPWALCFSFHPLGRRLVGRRNDFFILKKFHQISTWKIWVRLIQRSFHGKKKTPNSPDLQKKSKSKSPDFIINSSR